MKKFASVLFALLLICSLTVAPAYAAGKENWVAGGGFLIDNKASGVKVEETAAGIKVTQGGYYVDGVNWSGVASKNKYKLDGLTIVVTYDKVTKNDDCWLSFGFMEKPELFRVGDVKNARGYANLIRLNASPVTWNHYEVVDTTGNKWKGAGSQKMADTFKIDNGTTLTYSVKKSGSGYDFYLNDVKCSATFTQFNDIFANGEAYITLSASAKASAADAFSYTIKSINGEPTVKVETTATTAKAAATTAKAAAAKTTAAQTPDLIVAPIVLAAVSLATLTASRRRRG